MKIALITLVLTMILVLGLSQTVLAQVNVGDLPAKGNSDAPITIVEFSDFQCSFCARFTSQTLLEIQTKYIDTGKVKFYFRDFPLSFHQQAKPAALAARCADDQGKFWEFHDLIFENQQDLSEATYKQWASDLELNTVEFNSCFDSNKYSAEIDADFSAGQAVGVSGTPSFFINGHKVVGAQPFAAFENVIEQLLDGTLEPVDPTDIPEPTIPETQPVPPLPEIVDVDVGSLPVKGASNAPVTIIEFSDFECPFCGRFTSQTLSMIESEYVDTGKVKFYYRDFPLSFHQQAMPAAIAARCANEQGEFWAFHDLNYENQQNLGESVYKQWASNLGLNIAQFNSCFDSEKYETAVQADFAAGQAAGVSGTPSFFIGNSQDGYQKLVGAQSFAAFKTVIDQQLGVEPDPYPDTPGTEDMQPEPVKGNPNAPVTIVEFSDFECPFCARFFTSTHGQIVSEYVDAGHAKITFSNFPLSFHQNAQSAAEASECAHEQGKFWEFHDLVFENQNSLDVTQYKQWASQLGLNTARFNSCVDTHKYAPEVRHDFAQGQAKGVRGTPSFFINGENLVGAQPFSAFKAVIDKYLDTDEPETQPDDIDTEILDIVFKLESLGIKVDKLATLSGSLASYYSNTGDFARATHWQEVANMFDNVMDFMDEIKSELNRTRDLFDARNSISELTSFIGSIINKILGFV
ncbi:MAG: DsbA family protein [Candidatus Aenigmatarchaeota archaeon]